MMRIAPRHGVWPCLALVLGACVELAPARARVHRGPARNAPVHRVVALPATCGSLSVPGAPEGQPREGTPGTPGARRTTLFSDCAELELQSVDQVVRAALDFEGYRVIDSERVNATTWAHTERERTSAAPGRHGHGTTTQESERSGAAFADAPPALQRVILAELGAEGLLTTRIWLGAHIGSGSRTSGHRAVTVQVTLVLVATSEQVWARRCEVEVAGLVTDSAAMERAARCAAAGGRRR